MTTQELHQMSIRTTGDRSQCSRCFGFVDDYRHIGPDTLYGPPVEALHSDHGNQHTTRSGEGGRPVGG